MAKVVKGQDKTGPAVGYAAGLKRLERNRARREQRARAKRAAERAKKAVETPQHEGPKGLIDEYLAKDAEPSVFGGGAAAEATNAVPPGYSGEAALPSADRAGVIYGSPRLDPDLRLGRRSVEQPWDPKRVYDVRIVRATDNAVTMVKGLSQERAESLMLECARWFTDLVSIERTPRIEY
jgi:hypothetical protein